MHIGGIQIQPQTKNVVDSNRTVRVSDLLCKRCQTLIGYVFWDFDHSALEDKSWKSKKSGKSNFEQKEYVKIYKHCIVPCLIKNPEPESGTLDEYLSSEKTVLSSSPFLGCSLTANESFEVLMAKFFKHQAQESFYRFIVSSDSPSGANKKFFGLIRLLTTNGTILLSDKSLSLSEDFGWTQTGDDAEKDQIWGVPEANGCLNMYPIVRLNYLECPRETPTEEQNAWDDCLDREAEFINSLQEFNKVVNSWKKEIIGVTKLILPLDLVWRLFSVLTNNTSLMPPSSRYDNMEGAGGDGVVTSTPHSVVSPFKLGFLRMDSNG